MPNICNICKKYQAESTRVFDEKENELDKLYVSCKYCGDYFISNVAIRLKILDNFSNNLWLLSSAIFKENLIGGKLDLTCDSIPDIIKNTKQISVLGTIDNIVSYAGEKAVFINDVIIFRESDLPRFTLRDPNELDEYLIQIKNLGYWVSKESQPDTIKEWHRSFKLTLEGWKQVDKLRKVQADTNQAFVAMWFDDQMDQYYREGIKPALEKTGFDKIIMLKDAQHNGKIDDLIISSIRKSSLVVADFTGDRSAVYYEAGFANGLGINVIWLCKDSDKDNLCFDTRQYSHIIWVNSTDLKHKLIARIEATIPGHISK